MDAALCAQTDPDAWFPEPGGVAKEAKAVCARCPVRAECLELALRIRPQHGVWAGLSPVGLAQLRKEAA